MVSVTPTIEEILNDGELPIEERVIFAFLNVLDFCHDRHVHAGNAFAIALQRKIAEQVKAKQFDSIITIAKK